MALGVLGDVSEDSAGWGWNPGSANLSNSVEIFLAKCVYSQAGVCEPLLENHD